ncbi:MAG: Mov34/MPN/PAD-1 family protein [Mycobacterium leprae]
MYIPEALYRRVINHCREEKPLEACGLLAGERGHVLSAYATDNGQRSPVVYSVDHQQLVQALHEIESHQQQLVAIYHSHVRTPAVPSGTDVGQATWPEAFYVIVSLAHRRPQMRAWRIVDGQVTEHPVVIVREAHGGWYDLRRVAVKRSENDIS